MVRRANIGSQAKFTISFCVIILYYYESIGRTQLPPDWEVICVIELCNTLICALCIRLDLYKYLTGLNLISALINRLLPRPYLRQVNKPANTDIYSDSCSWLSLVHVASVFLAESVLLAITLRRSAVPSTFQLFVNLSSSQRYLCFLYACYSATIGLVIGCESPPWCWLKRHITFSKDMLVWQYIWIRAGYLHLFCSWLHDCTKCFSRN